MKGLRNRYTGWLALLIAGCCALGACKPISPKKKALEQGIDFLKRIQRSDGAISDTINPLFDIWETVEAATAIWEIQQDSADTSLQKALAFLHANENAAGMLCHNRKCRASYCLETTSEYLILLADIYGKERIQSRMDTIRKLQKPTGEWEIGNPDVLESKDFPSVTAFVLAAFHAAELEPQYPKEAKQWLIAQQDELGEWGRSWEYYGSSAYPFWVIARALHAYPSTDTDVRQMLKKAALHALSQQVDGEYWEPQDISKAHPSISRELQTALYISALQWLTANGREYAIGDGFQFLVEHQRPDGSWDGGLFPIGNERYRKEEYVFATARAMVAIKRDMDIHWWREQ